MSDDAPRQNTARSGPRVALLSFFLMFALVVSGFALADLHQAGRPILGIVTRALSIAFFCTIVLWFLRLRRPGKPRFVAAERSRTKRKYYLHNSIILMCFYVGESATALLAVFVSGAGLPRVATPV